MNKAKHYTMVSTAALAAAVYMGAGFGTVALAQTDSAASNPLEELVVTARRRDESALDVPVTLSAISAETIQARGATSLIDISRFTPSFTIVPSGGSLGGRITQGLTVRGIRAASVFIDGASAGEGLIEGVDDLARVEVLKGPQSAYFGRATFSGAINLVTKVPGSDPKASIDVLVGSHDWHDVRATVEGPLLGDWLSARLTARTYERDGLYKNYSVVGPEDKVGAQSTKSFNVALYAKPTDKFTARLFGAYYANSDGSPMMGRFRKPDFNCRTMPGAGGLTYLCGKLPEFNYRNVAQDVPLTPLFVNGVLNNAYGVFNPVFNKNYPKLTHPGSEARSYHVNFEMNYELPYGITLTSLTAANRSANSLLQDYDYVATAQNPNPTYVAGVGAAQRETFDNFLVFRESRIVDRSQEFRLTGDQENRLRWAAGLSYVRKQSASTFDSLYDIGLIKLANGEPTVTKTSGAFLSASYDIVPTVTLDFEGRYQIDNVILYNRSNADVKTRNVGNKFKNFIPRVNLSWHVTEDVMLYGTYGIGINPGGFNVQLLNKFPIQLAAFAGQDVSLVVDPEKLENYELGLKGQFFDRRLQITAAVYKANWKDQIVPQTANIPTVDAAGNPNGGTAFLTVSRNIGRTQIQGFEIEATARPVDRWTVYGSFSMNDSKIQSYYCLTCENLLGKGRGDISGNELAQYPKVGAAGSLEYRAPIRSGLDWYGRVDANYKSGVWESLSNLAKTRPTTFVNLRVGIQTETYKLEAFVLNALKENNPINASSNVDVLSPGYVDQVIELALPDPRMFGVRLKYNF